MRFPKWIVPVLLIGAACAPPRLADGFEAELRAAAACADLYLIAALPDESVALVFRATDAPLAELRSGGDVGRYGFSAEADTAAVLFAEVGSALAAGFCDGSGEPDVQRRYHAVSGAITLSLDAESDRLTLAATGLVLKEEHGDHEVALADFELPFSVAHLP